MKLIIKQFFFYLMLLGYLNLNAQNTDCPVLLLANDLTSSPAEFKTIVNESKGFDAWQLLNKEKPALRSNIEELNLVSKNLEEIKNTGGYLKWKALQGAGSLIDDALATVLKTHPNFSKLGLSVTELDDFKALLNTKMPNSASDIFGGLKSHLDAGTSFENMQQIISGLKNNWGNFSDGSKWVFNYTSSSKGLTQFGGKKIRFELPTETELGLRRIDIADVTNPSTPLLYEFKSVQTPFNSTYATQFVKDLETANSLSQIKWMYDGSKVSSLNKTQILNLIENSTIPQLPNIYQAFKMQLNQT